MKELIEKGIKGSAEKQIAVFNQNFLTRAIFNWYCKRCEHLPK